MALGGMYYKDPNKVAWIRKLLNLIETYIYGLPGLRDEHEGGLDLSQAEAYYRLLAGTDQRSLFG